MSKASKFLEYTEKIPGTKEIAQRLVRGEDSFLDLIMERGFTKEDANKIFDVYLKVKAIKRDIVSGNYTVKHGGYWDKEVLDRALEQYDSIMKLKKNK